MGPEIKPPCAWLITRRPRGKGEGEVIVLGPNLRKIRSTVPKEIIAQWAQDAPKKSTLWTAERRRQFSKLLIVLEEWTSPTWSRLTWGKEDNEANRTAVGLLPTTDDNKASKWEYLVLPEATSLPTKVGNGQVLNALH
jgi:hypothetical protein